MGYIGVILSGFFWWLNLVRLYSLYEILYPKRRIESYSIVGTIVSPNQILLIWRFRKLAVPLKMGYKGMYRVIQGLHWDIQPKLGVLFKGAYKGMYKVIQGLFRDI